MTNETPALKRCPFCGHEPAIVPCDIEGNVHLEAGYEDDPWSGLRYAIIHDYEECPVSTWEDLPYPLRYDTREQAAAAWNNRAKI